MHRRQHRKSSIALPHTPLIEIHLLSLVLVVHVNPAHHHSLVAFQSHIDHVQRPILGVWGGGHVKLNGSGLQTARARVAVVHVEILATLLDVGRDAHVSNHVALVKIQDRPTLRKARASPGHKTTIQGLLPEVVGQLLALHHLCCELRQPVSFPRAGVIGYLHEPAAIVHHILRVPLLALLEVLLWLYPPRQAQRPHGPAKIVRQVLQLTVPVEAVRSAANPGADVDHLVPDCELSGRGRGRGGSDIAREHLRLAHAAGGAGEGTAEASLILHSGRARRLVLVIPLAASTQLVPKGPIIRELSQRHTLRHLLPRRFPLGLAGHPQNLLVRQDSLVHAEMGDLPLEPPGSRLAVANGNLTPPRPPLVAPIILPVGHVPTNPRLTKGIPVPQKIQGRRTLTIKLLGVQFVRRSDPVNVHINILGGVI
mmetsp:Transcript_24184/g.55182  ORF Transcript_24184/g.55182 Transcript_24184/m.55182 type:complete len:425 (-) Transcript_24184:705-1979(-)